MEKARVPEARLPSKTTSFALPATVPDTSRIRFICFVVLGAVLFTAWPSAAAEVAIFRQDGRADALAGDVSGTSVGADGELRLEPSFERIAGLDEPFLFAAALHP